MPPPLPPDIEGMIKYALISVIPKSSPVCLGNWRSLGCKDESWKVSHLRETGRVSPRSHVCMCAHMCVFTGFSFPELTNCRCQKQHTHGENYIYTCVCVCVCISHRQWRSIICVYVCISHRQWRSIMCVCVCVYFTQAVKKYAYVLGSRF